MDGIGQVACPLCASASPTGKQGQTLRNMGPEAFYFFNFCLMMDFQVLEIDGSHVLGNISIFSTWPFMICALLASLHSSPIVSSCSNSILHLLWPTHASALCKHWNGLFPFCVYLLVFSLRSFFSFFTTQLNCHLFHETFSDPSYIENPCIFKVCHILSCICIFTHTHTSSLLVTGKLLEGKVIVSLVTK